MKYEKSSMGPRITELNKRKGPELLEPYTIPATVPQLITVNRDSCGFEIFCFKRLRRSQCFVLFMSHSSCVPLKEGRPARIVRLYVHFLSYSSVSTDFHFLVFYIKRKNDSLYFNSKKRSCFLNVITTSVIRPLLFIIPVSAAPCRDATCDNCVSSSEVIRAEK
jgi:hypothetical protein